MVSQSVILVLSSLGLAQAIFLMVYLLSLKKGNRTANLFLALIILGLTARIGKAVLNTQIHLEAWQRNLGISAILLVGPMLWFYGKAILQRQKTFGKRLVFHLMPFVLFAGGCALIPNRFDFISKVIYLSVFLHLAFYVALSTYSLQRERKRTSRPLFVWYRNLVLGVGLICVFYIGHFFHVIPFYIGGAIFFSFLIYCFSFLLLKRHNFTLEKYQNSKLDSTASKELIMKIKVLFEKEEVYLNSKLTLEKVSTLAGTSSRNVSRAINEHDGTNFSDFVNAYRIEKAKNLLVDKAYAKEKIAAIAYDCGFGNVTSFNLAFKAATKQTPSSYRSTSGQVST
ncbi:helix-turn-helix domain-containing protein [uncultured Croceitalea sp.]|uniref:helix-turn-helix domain-containing protein n=1 Tax=uncultured Croceitalea sp. TaxID=1798908 RepID=UPI00330580F3